MPQPLDLLRSLGNAGAVANAKVLLDARHDDEAALRDLLRRLPAAGPAGPARPAGPAHHAAA